MEIIGLILIGLFGAYLAYQQARLIYNRYLRTYKQDIRDYLDKRGFEFIDSVYPNNNDWLKSPFSKPPEIEFSFLLIKINGIFIKWSSKNYLIIIGQKKEKQQEFWLEIITTYFQKPVLSFREGKTIRNNDAEMNKDIKFVKVADKCPACGFKLSAKDEKCPDCELNFV